MSPKDRDTEVGREVCGSGPGGSSVEGRQRERSYEQEAADWSSPGGGPEAGGVDQGYGFMDCSRSGDGRMYARAPEAAWVHVGAGPNLVCLDPVNDVLVVARWIRGNPFDTFIGRGLAVIEGR